LPFIRKLSSEKINIKPLITHTFKFEESVEDSESASEHRPTNVKLQIQIDEEISRIKQYPKSFL
jgi:D-xylulose reductase